MHTADQTTQGGRNYFGGVVNPVSTRRGTGHGHCATLCIVVVADADWRLSMHVFAFETTQRLYITIYCFCYNNILYIYTYTHIYVLHSNWRGVKSIEGTWHGHRNRYLYSFEIDPYVGMVDTDEISACHRNCRRCSSALCWSISGFSTSGGWTWRRLRLAISGQKLSRFMEEGAQEGLSGEHQRVEKG